MPKYKIGEIIKIAPPAYNPDSCTIGYIVNIIKTRYYITWNILGASSMPITHNVSWIDDKIGTSLYTDSMVEE